MSSHGERLVEEVKRVALADPDRAYEPPEGGVVCKYVHEGQPSCLIGHALWNLGVIDAEFETYRDNGSELNLNGVEDVIERLGIRLNSKQIEFLSRAQNDQDLGMAWGEAIS